MSVAESPSSGIGGGGGGGVTHEHKSAQAIQCSHNHNVPWAYSFTEYVFILKKWWPEKMDACGHRADIIDMVWNILKGLAVCCSILLSFSNFH